LAAYTDNEDLDRLKVWWNDYGVALIIGVLLGLALLFGNKYWTQHQEQRRFEASDLYAQMLNHVREAKHDLARANGDKLIAEYDGTPYAGMAALLLARLGFDANDTATARKHLEWAVKQATDPAVETVARLRLARLHLASGEYDQALALVPAKPRAGFEAEYLELKGDIHVAQGKIDDARAAYDEALKQLAPDASHRRTLTIKLDDLGATKPQ
jgi:predicted negative regulator of RcsB-dependent stress response